MNVTLNNTYNRYNRFDNQCKPRPSFSANVQKATVEVAEDVAKELSSNSSKFFEPFTKAFDKASEWLCKTVAKPVLSSKWFGNFAEKFQNAGDRLFQHCLTTGSVITSGLYMQRTLTNKHMDKDRRNTLAVNQLLTLGVSTAGAYLLDGYLKNWWENVSARYVGHKIADKDFAKEFKDVNVALNGLNISLKANPDLDVVDYVKKSKNTFNMTERGHEFLTNTVNGAIKDAAEDGEKLKKFRPIKLDKFIKKLVDGEKIPKLSKTAAKQLKGISLLRSMIVFGFVYRYFVPVAVTKPANKLCDMYLESKKAKKEAKKTA